MWLDEEYQFINISMEEILLHWMFYNFNFYNDLLTIRKLLDPDGQKN